MWSGRTDGFLRSTSLRIPTLFAGIVAMGFAAAFVGVDVFSRSASLDVLRNTIRIEIHAIEQEALRSGLDAAIEEVVERSGEDSRNALGLNLAIRTPEGLIFGSPEAPDAPVGWSIAEGRVSKARLLVLAHTLPGGGMVTIAADADHGELIRKRMLALVALAGASAALIAALVGWWASRRMLGRMDDIAATLARAAGGDLSARLQAPKVPSDDLDDMAIASNVMFDRIEALVQNIQRVSADVAHQMRTPLSLVRQDLSIARRDATVAIQDRIDRADARIAGLLSTFDAMLRLAEIEVHRAQSAFRTFDLVELAETVTCAYGAEFEDVGGALDIIVEAHAQVIGDPDLMMEALANCLENALRYAGPAPRVEIIVRGGYCESWEVLVRDDGPGIAPEDRARVLAPFERAGGTSVKGNGLGLAIVGAVARLHGATLALEDAGPGLCVRIRRGDGSSAPVARRAERILTS